MARKTKQVEDPYARALGGIEYIALSFDFPDRASLTAFHFALMQQGGYLLFDGSRDTRAVVIIEKGQDGSLIKELYEKQPGLNDRAAS